MQDRKHTIGRKGLKIWGFLFTLMWVLSRALARGMTGGAEGEALIAILNSSPDKMYLATAVLIMESFSVCGLLLYSAMLLEGMQETTDVKKYFVRMGILALVSEIPYDLLMSGKFFDRNLQNPVFGLLVCQVVIYFWNRYADKKSGNLLIRLAVLAAAAAWCYILKVEYGLPLVVCTAVLWFFRKDTAKRGLAGMLAGGLCILFSPFFLAAPMGALVLHFYNGENWEHKNNLLSYAAFPVLMLLGCLLAAVMS